MRAGKFFVGFVVLIFGSIILSVSAQLVVGWFKYYSIFGSLYSNNRGVLSFILVLVMSHVSILALLAGLARFKEAFGGYVFQLAWALIAVPWCTNLVPGFIGLVV